MATRSISYHPDEENYDPEGHRDEVVEVGLGAAFFNQRNLPSAVSEGSFFDLLPFSVLTTSTLEQLGELEPQSRFDGDPRILKALAHHNRIEVASMRYPCARVYAAAEATGAIRKSDHISLT
jgi:hypothetical protein